MTVQQLLPEGAAAAAAEKGPPFDAQPQDHDDDGDDPAEEPPDDAREAWARERAVLAERVKNVSFEYVGGAAALPAELAHYMSPEAYALPGDCGVAQDCPPAWYDEALFRDGQRFIRHHLVGVSQAELTSLLILYAYPYGMDPLIATGKSDSPEVAGPRYMNTNLKLLSWFTSDPFDRSSEAFRNLSIVRRLHAAVKSAINNSSPDELAVKFTVGKAQPRALLCPQLPQLRRAFSASPDDAYAGPCPARTFLGPSEHKGALHVVVEDRYRRPFLAQPEMGMTQWAFFGLFICKPEVFGAPWASKKELESMVHVWAVIGYALGIEDRFNFALGGLDASRRRSEQFLRKVAVPALRRMVLEDGGRSAAWEHMGRCFVEGMRLHVPVPPYEVTVAYLAEDVLALGTALAGALSWWHTLHLWWLRLLLTYVPRCWPAWTRWVSGRFIAMSYRFARGRKAAGQRAA